MGSLLSVSQWWVCVIVPCATRPGPSHCWRFITAGKTVWWVSAPGRGGPNCAQWLSHSTMTARWKECKIGHATSQAIIDPLDMAGRRPTRCKDRRFGVCFFSFGRQEGGAGCLLDLRSSSLPTPSASIPPSLLLEPATRDSVKLGSAVCVQFFLGFFFNVIFIPPLTYSCLPGNLSERRAE